MPLWLGERVSSAQSHKLVDVTLSTWQVTLVELGDGCQACGCQGASLTHQRLSTGLGSLPKHR